MSTPLGLKFPATEESKSNPFASGPKLLLCGPADEGHRNLDLLEKAIVCAIDIKNAEELSSVVSATAPDLIVLSLEALLTVLSNKTTSINSAEDLEHALLGLCPRHAEIVRMIAKGLRNHEIATSLGLSCRTVKAILSSLYIRYDVTNRTELLGLLMEQGHLAATQLHPRPASERAGLLSPRPTVVRRSQKTIR